jgi:zinc protease
VVISLPLIPPETVLRVVLANGLTLLVRRDDSAPAVAIVTWVKAGYFDESDDVVGIAHVLEHMYFKGTPTRGVGDIPKETKAAGGYLNAGTIYDHTSYYTVLPSAGLTSGLHVQFDAYANSVIDADELRRELEVIIQEAKRKTDNPSAVTTETLYELLHDRHRIRRWRIGHEPGLRALTRDKLVAFYRNFYQPSETILVVVGDVDPALVVRQVEELHGSLPPGAARRSPGPNEPDHRGFRYREMSGDITQSHLALGWRTPGTMHPDTPLLDIAAVVLGAGRASRLYRAVRDRSLAASVQAYDYTPTELGVFSIQAEGPPERVLDAARAIWHETHGMRESGIGRDELWRARRLFESRWIRRLETMEGQANYLAEWESVGGWQLGERYLERMLTATGEQVTDVVRAHLAPERAGLCIYRPPDGKTLAPDAGAMRALLDDVRPSPLPVSPPRSAVAAAVHTGVPPVEREVARVRVYRTRNGIPVLVRHKRGAPLVHLGVFVQGGATEEDARLAGLTALLARTSIKGTARRGAEQIADDAEHLGGSIGTAVGAESFGWTLSVPASYADAALELLADVVQHPTFPESALDTERAIALADLALLRDDMYRYPLRLLAQAAFPGHPYGVPASGTEETLPLIDAERVRDWHRRRVLEAPLVIGAVGAVDADLVAERVAHCFETLRVSEPASLEPPPRPGRPVTVVDSRDKAQTALAMAFPGPSRTDGARFAAHLLAGVASGLGGRFFEELRDRRSLAYTVSAFASERRLAGLFVSYIATSPEREEEARGALLHEFHRLRESPVSSEELERARQYAIGTYAIAQQSGATVLGEVLDAWMFGGDLAELEEHDARVRAVTAEHILALARESFDESALVQAVVRGTGKRV